MTRRRRYRPISVERDAALNALGLLDKKINWDHRPPLSHRPFNPETNDYEPAENDPHYLFPMLAEDNQALNHGTHVPLSGDTSVAAKLKRVNKAQTEFRQRLLAKDAGEKAPETKRKRHIPNRPWPKKRSK